MEFFVKHCNICIVMTDKNTKRFFKLVPMQCSRFAKTYNIQDVDDIYPGRRFVSRGQLYDWCAIFDDSGYRQRGLGVHSAVPLIHFCDNTIDLLMWYYVSIKPCLPYSEVYFFEIKPLSPVHKQRCIDTDRLYQCGSHTIEIVKQLSFGDVLRIANQEIENECEQIIKRYPEQNMFKLIKYVQDNVYIKSK